MRQTRHAINVVLTIPGFRRLLVTTKGRLPLRNVPLTMDALRKKFCTCKSCRKTQETNLHGEHGTYILPSLWRAHQKTREQDEVEEQAAVVSDETLLRALSDMNLKSPDEKPFPQSMKTYPVIVDHSPISDIDRDAELGEETLIEKNAEDLVHLSRTVQQRLSVFESGPSPQLEFRSKPQPNLQYVSQFSTFPRLVTGPQGLKIRHAGNTMLMAFESWLLQMLEAVEDVACQGEDPLLRRKKLTVDKIHDALRNIDDIKAREWKRQQQSEGREQTERTPEGPDPASAPLKVETDRFLKKSEINKMESLPAIALFVVAVLNILCSVSRNRCNFVLAAIRLLLDQALQAAGADEWLRRKTKSSIDEDVRTVISHFDVMPSLVPYVCCPKCSALYIQGLSEKEDGYPETCTSKDTIGQDERPCGARLRKDRMIRGKRISHPIRTYLYQDLPTWLARIVCRPGFEALMDRTVRHSVRRDAKDILHDIWDSPVVQGFLGPDSKPFYQYKGPEGRFLFSLSYDDFNPFGNKHGGKNVSLGVIFMVCLNLPPEIRYKLENSYLVGVVPGPKKPALAAINHYLRPLVEHLRRFYESGFFLTATPGSPDGRLFKGAVLPVICDLPAARQIAGIGNYNSKFFCSFCGLPLQDIQNVNTKDWPPRRSCDDHRRLANEWKEANIERRKELFKENSTRWSELSSLPYWRPLLYTLFDTMHGWFLNDFENHVRNIWKVDGEKPSSDGLSVGGSPKTRQRVRLQDLLQALRAIRDQTERDKRIISSLSKPTAYRLCELAGLSRGGSKKDMRDALMQHYGGNDDILLRDITTLERDVKVLMAYPDTAEDDKLTNARTYLLKIANDTQEKAVRYLSNRTKRELMQLFVEWGLNQAGQTYTKDEMAKSLVAEQLQTPHTTLLPTSSKPQKAVIGKDLIQEIDADISRTVLPSWVAPGPTKFSSGTHGSLKADEWRTMGMIRLVISLPRVWGPKGGRHTQMLKNFMHLIRAVKVGGSLSVVAIPTGKNGMKRSTADFYREEYQAYLNGVIELYPTAEIKPNMHIAYHVGELLESFGPVHSWRSQFYERFIKVMKDNPHNSQYGQLHNSFMKSFCMGSNFRAFVNDSTVPESIRPLREHFQSTFYADATGTMLHDLLRLQGLADGKNDRNENPNSDAARLQLDEPTILALAEYLNSKEGNDQNTSPYVTSGKRQAKCVSLDHFAWELTQHMHSGTLYRRVKPTNAELVPGTPFEPHIDSHAIVKNSDGTWHPISIQNLFSHRRKTPGTDRIVSETFCILRKYRALSSKHEHFDQWRQFPIVGGRLYYDQLHAQSEIINVTDLAGHFAKTPYKPHELSPRFSHPCIHVLPLDWHSIQQPE